jgi:hypothetical protein
VIVAPHTRLGRNDPCWCGSGRKYKVCHLDEDRSTEEAKRQQASGEHEQGQNADHRCAPYRPGTRKVPAAQRPDFITTVRNLASAGDGAWLHIDGPADLGRDQASVDAAINYLDRQGVLPDFRLDPEPPVVAAAQELLDRMSGRGVFTVVPSGVRLRKYGQTEIVSSPDGSGFIAYVTGKRSLRDVVILLIAALATDGRALGVTGGILAEVWPIARVAREIVINHLALPGPLLNRADELVEALIELISSRADVLESSSASPSAALVQATLPYLVGLREAVPDPEGQLDGMGLSPRSVETVSIQLDVAAKRPEWLHRLAEVAGDAWDTPDGYAAWIEAARSITEVAGLLDSLPSETEQQSGEVAVPIGEAASTAVDTAEVAPDPASTGTLGSPPPPRLTHPAPVASHQPPRSLFSDVDSVAVEHALRRQAVHERLTEILDRQADIVRRRIQLEADLRDAATDEADIGREQAEATGVLEAEAEGEARSRHETIMSVLTRGAAALDDAAAAWSDALHSAAGRNDDTITEAERVVREYEDMLRRGLLEQLPAGIRDNVQRDVEQAKAALRELLGGRDPLTLPAVVAATEEESALTLSVGLPLLTDNDLAPGSLHTVVAAAVAEVVAETVRSMPQIDVASVDHVSHPDGASVLRVRFTGPSPVTAEDCAQYCALNLTDVGQRSPALRQAGVSIEARVEPDLELEV